MFIIVYYLGKNYIISLDWYKLKSGCSGLLVLVLDGEDWGNKIETAADKARHFRINLPFKEP